MEENFQGRRPVIDDDPSVSTAASEVPLPRLARQAVLWLGITAMWVGLGSLLAGRLQFQRLVAPGTEGASLLRMTAVGTLVAIVVQPAIGAVSDHTVSRWGRRLPFIVAGGLCDVLFLAGIALSQSVLAIAAFFLLLQVSSNIAQGPYQGLIPDLVPRPQVGAASALIGLMLILGNVLGYIIGAIGIATGAYPTATIGLGIVELATMVVLLGAAPDSGQRARPRDGRSWWAVARSSWGRDTLRAHGFLWFVGSRLAVLTGSEVLVSLGPFYLARTFDLGAAASGQVLLALVGLVAIGTAFSVLPAARLSDRIGRRAVIWIACGIGAASLALCAVAPTVPIALVGATSFGIAGGSFLAVDWALLSELVPRADAAGFMGISNVATASAGMLAVGIGGTIMDVVGGADRGPAGPRAALAFGVMCYLVGAFLLLPVDNRRSGRGPT